MTPASGLADNVVRQIGWPTRRYAAVMAVLVLYLLGWIAVWYVQLDQGLAVTGLRDIPSGVPWGIYLVNFVFFVGIAHAGIAMAATVRLLKLREFAVIGRMAELLTVFGLMMAGLSIMFDLGRPDRVFELVRRFPERLPSSPLAWDVLAIITYFVVSTTYLYLELREDIARLADRVPWRGLYRRLLPLRDPGERPRVDRLLWWASVFVIPIMVTVHATVAWIFGLLSSQPGWYGAIQAPYFLLGAVLSGLAAVVVVAAIYRSACGWQAHIPVGVFRGLNRVLCWLAWAYLFFQVSELLTALFAGPLGELHVSIALLRGEFAWLYRAEIVLIALAAALFTSNAMRPERFSVRRTSVGAAFVVAGLWLSRYLIIVPPLTRSWPLQQVGAYSPTWVEWVLVSGTFVLLVLLYMVFTRVFPIVSLTELSESSPGAHDER